MHTSSLLGWMFVIAAFKPTSSLCHWPAIFVLAAERSGDVGPGTGSPYGMPWQVFISIFLKLCGYSAPQFPLVLWIMREIIDNPWPVPLFFFSHSWLEFSFLIKKKIKEWELNTSWFIILLKMGSWESWSWHWMKGPADKMSQPL